MPNTGLPRPPWRCRVCSMKPSPPSATEHVGVFGFAGAVERGHLRQRPLRFFGGTGEKSDARGGHGGSITGLPINVGAGPARDSFSFRKPKSSRAGPAPTGPSVLDRQLRQTLDCDRGGRIVERLLRRQFVEHGQGEAQRQHRRARSSCGPWRRRWRPASTAPGR